MKLKLIFFLFFVGLNTNARSMYQSGELRNILFDYIMSGELIDGPIFSGTLERMKPHLKNEESIKERDPSTHFHLLVDICLKADERSKKIGRQLTEDEANIIYSLVYVAIMHGSDPNELFQTEFEGQECFCSHCKSSVYHYFASRERQGITDFMRNARKEYETKQEKS